MPDCDGVPRYPDDPVVVRDAPNYLPCTVLLDLGGNQYLVQRERAWSYLFSRQVSFVTGDRLMYLGRSGVELTPGPQPCEVSSTGSTPLADLGPVGPSRGGPRGVGDRCRYLPAADTPGRRPPRSFRASRATGGSTSAVGQRPPSQTLDLPKVSTYVRSMGSAGWTSTSRSST